MCAKPWRALLSREARAELSKRLSRRSSLSNVLAAPEALAEQWLQPSPAAAEERHDEPGGRPRSASSTTQRAIDNLELLRAKRDTDPLVEGEDEAACLEERLLSRSRGRTAA